MNSFLLTLSALLILVISALFAAPFVIDWNEYRPVFEAQASQALGRKVKVDGEVHFVILPAPELRFDNIKVADHEGRFETPFLEARSVEALLSIGSLMTGAVEARKIAVQDPVLKLDLRADGTGNWSDLGETDEAPVASFMPKSVMLDAVSVTGGTVAITKDGRPQFVLTQVAGDASAASLSGPYKVSATYLFEGRTQELRFSTSGQDAEGALRLKAALRDPEQRATYVLDGGVTGLGASPSYDGKLVMRIADPSAAPAPLPDAASPSAEKTPSEATSPEEALVGTPASFFELKGDLKASLDRAELPAFDVTIHAKGRPQLLKGRLALEYGERPRVEGEVTARWLDLDSLFATQPEEKLAPLVLLSTLAEKALLEAAKLGEGVFSIAVEQASVAGDLVGGIDLALTANGEAITVSRLDTTLPGDNRLAASGKVTRGENGPSFTGPVSLQGAKLRPLMRWAVGDRDMSAQTAVGDFALSADVTLGNGKLQLANAQGELSGTKFRGQLTFQGGEQRVIALELDSDRLDLREVLGDTVAWQSWLPAKAEDGVPPSERNLLEELRDDTAKVTLRVGELLLPGIPGGRLDAHFSLAKNSLDVEQLDFAAPNALALNGEGRVANISDAPSGGVTFALSAQTREALGVAAGLVGLPESISASKHLGGLVPFDVQVGLVAEPAGDATKASLDVKGMAGRSDVAITAQATGMPAKLGDAEIDLAGSVTGDKPQIVLGLLFPNLPPDRLAAAAGEGGKLSATLRGVPNKEVGGQFGLETAAMKVAFDGTGALRDDGIALTGKGTAVSGDASLALALLGLEAPPSASTVPLALSASVKKTGPALAFDNITGTIAGEPVQGAARLDLGGPGTKLSVTATADYISLPSLLGTLVAWHRTPSTEEMLGAIGAGATVWPSRGFALGPLAGTEGDITLNAKTLSLGAPIEVNDAALVARLDQHGLTVTELKGQLFGGAFVASGTLLPRGAGASLTARADLTGGRLEDASKAIAGASLAKGAFSLGFNVSGEGLSPPGIVAGLSGEGNLSLDPGTLQAFNPAPFQRVAATARRNAKATKEQIAAQAKSLRDGITKGTYRYEAASIPFEVKNGTLRLTPTVLAGKGAETEINAYVELASLKLDSEWKVALKDKASADLPPISLVFAGPLNLAGEISPTIDTVSIESYLTMRRMKEDVERLETLDVSGKAKPPVDEEAPVEALPEPVVPQEPQAAPAVKTPDKANAPAAMPRKPVPSASAAPSEQKQSKPLPAASPSPAVAAPKPAPASLPAANAVTAPAAPLPQERSADMQPNAVPPGSDPLDPAALPPLDGEAIPLPDPTQEAVVPAAPRQRPAPRPRRPRPDPDDWKKNIPIFGGG